jgi:EAL domain-containing protein (putative c-di-GMP-specific phosphodiesterase class I)
MLSLESHDSSVHSEITIKDSLLFNELQDMILNNKIRTVFQPIVSLSDGSVLGYEALSRGPEGSNLERPDVFFRIARKYNFGSLYNQIELNKNP